MTGLKSDDPVEYLDFPAIDGRLLRDYANASGDPNLIHLDESVARQAGLPGVIAHGMLIAGWVAERAQSYAAEKGKSWRLKRLQTRFKAMTLIGDVISVGGTVKNVSETGFSLQLEARKNGAETVIQATAEFTL